MNSEKTSLIEFPTHFQLKIMGAKHDDFVQEILKTICEHAPDTCENNITLRPSSKGNYLGATVTVYATSQAQLDNIYRSITAHPMVKVVF